MRTSVHNLWITLFAPCICLCYSSLKVYLKTQKQAKNTMQPDAANARQQIVERVKQATNILIAVGTDPSIDALSAALGMALLLNKMDKHATAVFSGKMPAS